MLDRNMLTELEIDLLCDHYDVAKIAELTDFEIVSYLDTLSEIEAMWAEQAEWEAKQYCPDNE